MIDNPKVADEIEKKIKTKLGIGVPRAVADLPIDSETDVSDSPTGEVAASAVKTPAVSKVADAKAPAAAASA